MNASLLEKNSTRNWPMPHLSPSVVLCGSCVEGIDKLGWPAGFTFSCYGARIGVRVNDERLLDKALEYLPPHARPASSGEVKFLYSVRDGNSAPQAAGTRIRRFHLLYLNTLRMARGHNLDAVWEHFGSALHFNVAMGAPEKLFVHAGVVGWKGGALVFPGRTLSGKSTLVKALIEAGATYYSDEYAVFDAQGRVHPYAKPLSLRDQNGKAHRVAAREFTEKIGNKPLPVSTVVVTQFQDGARFRARAASAGQGVLDLLDNTVLAQQRPGDALSYLNAALQDARVLKSKRGEADALVEALLR